jgi:hypothetical protein
MVGFVSPKEKSEGGHTFGDLSSQVGNWSLENFGAPEFPSYAGVLGCCEEFLCEAVAAQTQEEFNDAVADGFIYLADLCYSTGCPTDDLDLSFSTPHYPHKLQSFAFGEEVPFIVLAKNLGVLSRVTLKMRQCIRGYDKTMESARKFLHPAIMDVFYAAVTLYNGRFGEKYDLDVLVWTTWERVKRRYWKANPAGGEEPLSVDGLSVNAEVVAGKIVSGLVSSGFTEEKCIELADKISERVWANIDRAMQEDVECWTDDYVEEEEDKSEEELLKMRNEFKRRDDNIKQYREEELSKIHKELGGHKDDIELYKEGRALEKLVAVGGIVSEHIEIKEGYMDDTADKKKGQEQFDDGESVEMLVGFDGGEIAREPNSLRAKRILATFRSATPLVVKLDACDTRTIRLSSEEVYRRDKKEDEIYIRDAVGNYVRYWADGEEDSWAPMPTDDSASPSIKLLAQGDQGIYV